MIVDAYLPTSLAPWSLDAHDDDQPARTRPKPAKPVTWRQVDRRLNQTTYERRGVATFLVSRIRT